MPSDKTRILFVCLGNICRSPMAEAVFAHTVKQRGLQDHFSIDSAGTAAYHVGNSPDPRSVAACNNNGVAVCHSARQVSARDFEAFDYILCMDESNLHDLKRKQPAGSRAAVSLFGSYSSNDGDMIIEDPYYGGPDGFALNFEQVSRCSDGLLKRLGY